jgi:hypothetical protein
LSQKKIKAKRSGQVKQLLDQKKLTSREVARALQEASDAIDRLSAENHQLRRIVVAERAQVIHYTEEALAFAQHKKLDLDVRNFADLLEADREGYIKRAIAELAADPEVPAPAPGKIEIVQ